jgi:hypothetical protein
VTGPQGSLVVAWGIDTNLNVAAWPEHASPSGIADQGLAARKAIAREDAAPAAHRGRAPGRRQRLRHHLGDYGNGTIR